MTTAPDSLPPARPPRRKKPSRRPTPRRVLYPAFDVNEILRWADAFHARTGGWPIGDSGAIPEAPRETWSKVDAALRLGLRDLPGQSSLARLLAERRGVRNRKALPPYTEEQILIWADAYFRKHGRWPTSYSGPILEAPGETWTAVEMALAHGIRGLPGGSSLALLLAEQRGHRNKRRLPPYTEEQLLAWADAHHGATGTWPTTRSGPIAGAPGETWGAVHDALAAGLRGLPGGSSLPRLLAARRGVPNRLHRPRLTVERILSWADAHHAREGDWPKKQSGPILEAPGDTWNAIDAALDQGGRDLPGGSSLARLLLEQRGVEHHLARAPFTPAGVLAWADAYHQRHGDWPHVNSGPIEESPGETWAKVNQALTTGLRGFPGGSSLARFLAVRRGVRNQASVPPLAVEQILRWADAWFGREGRWPTMNSGALPDALGETWSAIDNALRSGRRGLPGGSSLAQLLAERRDVRNIGALPPLTVEQVLDWADAYRATHGQWPTKHAGPIEQSPGETWAAIDGALHNGQRGLPSDLSLARLLAQERGRPHLHERPPLTVEGILGWADAHREREGVWPRRDSGPVLDAPGEEWHNISQALRLGLRGLPGGLSLAQLLAQQRGVRNRKRLPRYSEEQILTWADDHYRKHGRWPSVGSGAVEPAPEETWRAIDAALRKGMRGLPGGSSLSRLIEPRHASPPTPAAARPARRGFRSPHPS